MDDDEYALTEAEVLDTLQFVVAAEQHEAARAKEEEESPQKKKPGFPEVDAEEDDELDEPEEDQEDQDKAEASAGSQAKRASGSGGGNPYQNRQKQELDYLKAKVRELELELRRVEKENNEKLAKVGDSVWQRMAQQQYVEKQRAVSENARLKEMLEGQIKFAKSLERVIRKRPNLTAFGVGEGDPAHGNGGAARKTRRRKKRTSSASLYDELSEAAEREFKRTDDELYAAGLLQILRDHRSIDIKVVDEDPTNVDSVGTVAGRATNSSDLRVDWTIARRYPFPFQSVARELWKFLSYANVAAHIPDMERSLERTEDTLFATTALSVAVGHNRCGLTASAIIRRFVQEDSVTVLWVSDGECEPSRQAKDTFKIYEIGWIKIVPIPDDPTSCVSYTLCHYYPTFSPRGDTSSTSSEGENAENSPRGSSTSSSDEPSEGVGLLTELVASLYEKSASQVHTFIENALMAEAIAQKEDKASSLVTQS